MPLHFSEDSAAWLGPMLAVMTLPPVSDGDPDVWTYRPVLELSDGSRYVVGIPDLNGKGVSTSDLLPGQGTVPTGTVPTEPVTTPRNSTPVSAGYGLSLEMLHRFVVALDGVSIIARRFGDVPTAVQDERIIRRIVLSSHEAMRYCRTALESSHIKDKHPSAKRTRIYGASKSTP